MELTGKQRARLRSMANTLPVVLYIGKEGVTDATVKEAYDALQARELIKCSLMDSAPLDVREACGLLYEAGFRHVTAPTAGTARSGLWRRFELK